MDAITSSRSCSTLSLNSCSKNIKSQPDRDCEENVNVISGIAEVTLARALMDVTAQHDGELTFQKGELIEISEILDDNWFCGRCGSKKGLVSAACVELIKNDYMFELGSSDSKIDCRLSAVDNNYHSTTPLHDPDGGCESLRIEELESRSRSASSGSFTSENTRSHDVEITPFGRVIYPFTSKFPSELSLSKNSIVTLIKHVDQDWTEGEVDGKRGIFPTSYIEIVVDCPYAYSQDVNGSQPSSILSSGEINSLNNIIDLHIEDVTSSVHLNNSKNGRESSTTSKIADKFMESQENGISVSSTAGIAESNEVAVRHNKGLAIHNVLDSGNVHVNNTASANVVRPPDKGCLEINNNNNNNKVGAHVPKNHTKIIEPRPKEETMISGKWSDNAVICKSLPDSESNPAVQLSSIDTTDFNFAKTSGSATAMKTVPVFKPSLLPNAKPPTLPKPDVPLKSAVSHKPSVPLKSAVSHKPALAPKPSSVISPNYFQLTKPNSISKQVLSQFDKDKSLSTSSTIADNKILEAKSLNSYTCVQSVSLDVSDISGKKGCCEVYCSNTEDGYIPYKKANTNARNIISAAEASSIASPSRITNNHQGCNERKDILPTSFSFSEHSTAKPSVAKRRKSTSFAEQLNDVLKLSAQNLKHANKASTENIREDTITNLNTTSRCVSFSRPTSSAPVRPNNEWHDSVTSDTTVALTAKLKSPLPCPVPQKSKSPSSDPQILTKVETPDQFVPKRPAPILENNHNRDRRAQQMSSYIAQPPRRHPPRPTSFHGAPKRPPPRPSSLTFTIPRTYRAERTSLEHVDDLKRKLEENQANIKKYEQTRSDLQQTLIQADSQTKEHETTKISLEIIESQLNVLLEEERSLKENLFAASTQESKLEKSRLLAAQNAVEEEKRREEEEKRKEDERKKTVERKEKRKIQREKVIEEIINTERDYLFSLNLCLDTFYDDQKPPTRVDLDFLLGNMEEIADVSHKMLINLEDCMSGKSLEEQCIGQCFINFSEDMKNTYAPYCRNHDEVITAMEQYADSTEISSYFNSKIEMMKKQTNVFDMASILIRPVQRILKYPLLLNELLKNTEEEHPDREAIETAIKEMTDVARAINEYKRRKDLVYKYKKLTDETFSDKISKLNLHSIKKKSSRIRGRLSTNLGIALQMKDEMFEKEEAKFRHMERTIRIFLNSLQQYLEQSQETMTCQMLFVDDIKDFYQGKECPEATKLYEVTCKQLSLFDHMKSTVENDVIVPLNILVGLFDAPTKVIEKRFDKMLDYNYQLGKIENDKEMQAAKNDYEAMNAQLLDELPKLYNLAFRMLRHCISAFILARRDFMDQSLKESCALLELPSMASKANLMDTFKIRHTTAFDHMSMLSFIPKGFNTKVDTVKADRVKQKGPGNTDGSKQLRKSLQSSTGSQNENRRRYLYQLYPPDKLYTVTSTYNAVDLMDISVTEGSLVAVVKELDPMGNKERWFVDDGGGKGFIPCSILSPLEHSPSGSIQNADEEDDIISILSGDSGDGLVLTGNDDRVESHTNNTFTHSYSNQAQSPQYQYYYPLYDFKSRHSNETSLIAGHPVAVLAFHDLDGNSEWWLVDSEGKRGYAPANYMAPMSYS